MSALSTASEIIAFADKITAYANGIHAWLIKAINDKKVDQSTAQAIFQDESILRQRANGLYLDAANCIVKDLQTPQSELLGVIDDAKESLENIKEVASAIDLIADILVLVGAAYAAKPAPILAAIKEVKADVDALKKNKKPNP